MNEKDIAIEIFNVLLNEKNAPDILIQVFINLWKPKNPQKLIKNLSRFCKEYNLDYLMVLQPRTKNIIAVRFWKNKKIRLLEKSNELQN